MIKDIPGHFGYGITRDGRVWSYKRRHWLKLHVHKRGHMEVALCAGSKTVSRKVHQLVLETWALARPPGAVARHLDGDPTNNHVENLAWGTQRENAADRDAHGRTARHERHGKAKLTMADAVAARWRYFRGETVGQLATDYQVNPGTMSKLVRGITWRMPS